MKKLAPASTIAPTLLLAAACCAPALGSTTTPVTLQSLPSLPLTFEINGGQLDEQVRFTAQGNGYRLFLTADGALFSAAGEPAAPVRMTLAGATGPQRVTGLDELATRSHYLRGNDPARWHVGIPHFARVRYEEVYPGVDLIFHGKERSLEYDFVVAPGADPARIALLVSGARRIELGAAGELRLRTASGEIVQHAPVAFQLVDGRRLPVAARFVVGDGSDSGRKETARRIAFAIGAYDRSRPLVIDPVLEYSTYLGGTSFDGATDVAVDGSGNLIVVGNTSSPTFPGVTAASIDPSNAPIGGAFVTKIDAAGTAILYSTFLSGTADPMNANAVAVDAAGNAYVVGGSSAPDMPGITAMSMDSVTVNGDAYIVKIDPAGSTILYGTFLGDVGTDNGSGVAVDAAGNAYVTGDTSSTTFLGVTAASLQSANAGPTDYFLTKINPGGTATVYSTFLGGSGLELAADVAVDPAGNAYVAGWSASTTFPGVTGASLQPSNAGGVYDATVTKIAASGTSILYSTFLGGSGWDTAHGIAVSPVGDAWITGETDSPSFPGASSSFIQPLPGGGRDAFVAKLGPTGTTLPVSTYLGGTDLDVGLAIAVDADGTAYVAGATRSTSLPGIGPESIQSSNAGADDAFVSAIEARGLRIRSTFLGGGQLDSGGGIAVDGTGALWVVGVTASPGFPGVSPSSIQPLFAGVQDAFVTRITGMGFVFGIPALSGAALVLLAGLLAGAGLLLVRRLRPS